MSSKRNKDKARKIESESSADEVGAESSAEELVEESGPVQGDSAQDIERELEALKQRFQRLGADFQNYQKRSYRQVEQAAQMARDEMALSLLGVLDNFEHTLAKGREADNIEKVLEGVKIVYDHLFNALTNHGLQRIEVKRGESFDPTRHEAMLQEANDEWPENTIVRELSPGYMMKDRTLRPAKVSVTKPPGEAEGSGEENFGSEEDSEGAEGRENFEGGEE